jgi:hypothetical protein
VTGSRIDPKVTTFFDPDADPASPCLYWIGSTDPVGFETVLGPFLYTGPDPSPTELTLGTGQPNPSRTSLALVYSIPSTTPARLAIYDAAGRIVRTLLDGPAQPGVWTADWDGRDDTGASAPSGIYFARLEVGTEQRSVKLTRVR